MESVEVGTGSEVIGVNGVVLGRGRGSGSGVGGVADMVWAGSVLAGVHGRRNPGSGVWSADGWCI
jgi:hypothetical protein